jgi:hypothetical protein
MPPLMRRPVGVGSVDTLAMAVRSTADMGATVDDRHRIRRQTGRPHKPDSETAEVVVSPGTTTMP